MSKKLFIIFLLGFSSGLPLSLLTGTLQAWFSASGVPVLTTGMLSLVGLPFIIRILWSPFVDRFSLSCLGLRRSWMLVTQVFLLLGFNLLAINEPKISPGAIGFIAFILALCAATQDTAIDAQRIEYLPKVLHGLGAAISVVGYRIALLIGGGFALIIAGHYGWTVCYRLMSLLMLIGVLATCWSREPERINQPTSLSFKTIVSPFREILQRPRVIPLLLLILFYKSGEAFTATTSGIIMPFLIQGLGFSLETIGWVNKIVGVGAIVLGGLIGGVSLRYYSLYKSLFLFGLIQAIANIGFIILSYSPKNLTLLYSVVICDNFVAGMGTTALVALLMRLVDTRYTATQYSLFIAVSTLPRVLSGPIAGLIHLKFGWTGVYQFVFFISLLYLPFLVKIKDDIA